MLERLLPGGFLVVGKHESPPAGLDGLVSIARHEGLYRRDGR
jgi:hypothetical protein